MSHVPGLRSPYARVGRLVYFGRMLDKIRLHAAGKLPAEYQDNLGEPRAPLLDGRCCRFLGISYVDLVARTRAGGSDAEILAWAEARGTPHTDDECNVWNRFMTKIGWRDDRTAALQQRISEFGLVGKPIETFFDLLDFDEGRDPVRARAWELKPATVIVIMGVSGSGKTTVGLCLSDALGWTFRDADDFHPPQNVAKMAAGIPLNDDDRAPWLRAIRDYIEENLRNDRSAIVTCSALKKAYRETIVVDREHVKTVYLKGSPELLAARIAGRQDHFMKPQMLASQLAILEEPSDALAIDVSAAPAEIVRQIRAAFQI